MPNQEEEEEQAAGGQGFGRVERLLLNGLLQRRTVGWEEAVDLYRTVCELADVAFLPDELVSRVSRLNRHLSTHLDMEVRRGADPEGGGRVLGLVNLRGDGIAELATEYDAKEIDFFKRCLQLIVTGRGRGDPAYKAGTPPAAVTLRASSNQLLAAASDVKNLSKRDAEVLLERFVADGWLLDRNGKLSLAVRAMLELKLYLREEYGDELLPDCALCLEMVTVRREGCSTCGALLHRYCLRRLQGAGQVQPKCPGCKQPWPGLEGPAPVALDAMEAVE